MSMYVRISNEDGTYTEKKVYSEEDMKAFAVWIDKGWTTFNGLWYNWYVSKFPKEKNMKTSDELLQKWEEQK